MSVSQLIKRFEKEKKEIHEKIKALQERDAFLDVLLKEVKGASRKE